MPINFDLEALRVKYNCTNYFETGLWDPRENVSSKKAIACGFEKISCIEIRKDWVELGLKVFDKEIDKGRYALYQDDSTNMAKYLTGDDFHKRTMFFLDAHVDNENIHKYKKYCPLFEELSAIASLERKDHIIMIDDLRIIKGSFPWGERSYGDIDFLQQIKNQIRLINGNYKFSTLDGHVPDDVLIAYV